MNYTLLEFEELISTNDFLKENHSYFPHMTIIRANHQTKGRGQFERKWQSNASENILCSILLKKIKTHQSHEIKRWVLLSLIRFFENYGLVPSFKEPNDIYVNHQKIAGILIESLSSDIIFDHLIIGIGININQTEFEKIEATSLSKESHHTFDLKEVFNLFLKLLVASYPNYIEG
ncbi:MAG: biotin--[acetyl-CoA-carboxylase] ligase [Acholeplasmataceae bacterium]|jgi:biotin-[acetyl-CoA-carboxylase] ligase BirA-like protein|nr:biotin--[acetyl-CoA-carboxylase] ligase [Acholeplasmataceae bacterium]